MRLFISSVACVGMTASMASAQLYAASGSNSGTGHLYTLDQSTGAMISDLGALADANGRAYGMTGMAFIGGTLYGATSLTSVTNPGWLVTINTANAQVTAIGSMLGGGSMSDITVIGGTLYGWKAAGHSLTTINLITGLATNVGSGNPDPGFGGGGLAANAGGTMFASPNAVSQSNGFAAGLYTVNTTTGALTFVGPHTGLVGGHALNAMQFVGSTLYAIDSDRGAPAQSVLTTVNTSTGALTAIGPTGLNDLDALAAVPEPATCLALGAGALALLRRRRRK